jgi:hypothetical protein
MSNTTNQDPPPLSPENPDTASTFGYPYYKYIRSPAQMGLNDKGKNIGKNFKGLMAYVHVLVSGTSRASATGKPLGDRVFIKAPSKCKDVSNNTIEQRYMYFDNIPSGSIPLDLDPSSSSENDAQGNPQMAQGTTLGLGGNKGLFPGIMEDIAKINPITLFKELEDDIYPSCHRVTLDTIDTKNQLGAETHYVADRDLKWINPCLFSQNINVVTKAKCVSKTTPIHVAPLTYASYKDASGNITDSSGNKTDPSGNKIGQADEGDTTTEDAFSNMVNIPDLLANHYTELFDNFTQVYNNMDKVVIAVIIIYGLFILLYSINKFIQI